MALCDCEWTPPEVMPCRNCRRAADILEQHRQKWNANSPRELIAALEVAIHVLRSRKP